MEESKREWGPVDRHGTRLLRWLLGLVLGATALGKSLDLSGFAEVVGTYQVLPEWTWLPAGVALTVIEWAVAVWLVSGRQVAQAALAAAALHTVFVVWATVALVRGLDIPNCGCFGVFYARPLTLATVFEDVVILIVCLTVYGLARRHQTRIQLATSPGPSSGGAATL